MRITQVTDADLPDWTDMALLLWPGYDREAMDKILRDLMASEKDDAFICREDDGSPIGFLTVSVRSDYVEGSDSSPCGFVEGIFVAESHRKQDVGRRLIEQAERWTLGRGLSELGSDALLENTNSHAFHRAVGFDEAARLVAFIKKLR